MKKLFLSSSFADVTDGFRHFLSNVGPVTNVAFIPTASTVEKITFYVKSGRKALEHLGLTIVDLDISQVSETTMRDTLEKADLVYVTGGNTFFLLQELKRTKADQLLSYLIAQGKPYVGESAGAMILAPSIDYVKAMDSVKKAPLLASHEALGVVDFYPVPHVGEFPFKKAGEKIKQEYQSSRTLYPINNHQAIVVLGARIEVVG